MIGTMKKRTRRLVRAAAMLATMLVVVSLLFAVVRRGLTHLGDRLPVPGQVNGMTAEVYESEPRMSRKLGYIPPFLVPRAHVSKILAAMAPVERVKPTKQGGFLAILTFECEFGTVITVYVFRTQQERTSFIVGDMSSGAYYRGGSNEDIENALRAAYEVVKNRRD